MTKLETLAKKVEAGELHFASEARTLDYLFVEVDPSYKLFSYFGNAIGGSIDAVEKLRAELLPDSVLKNVSNTDTGGKYYCELGTISKYTHSIAPTEAAARLAALLRALDKGQDDEK